MPRKMLLIKIPNKCCIAYPDGLDGVSAKDQIEK